MPDPSGRGMCTVPDPYPGRLEEVLLDYVARHSFLGFMTGKGRTDKSATKADPATVGSSTR